MSNLQVGVAGLFSNANIGDYLLVETAKFLVLKEVPDARIRDVDVDPRGAGAYPGRRRLNLLAFRVLARGKNTAMRLLMLPLLQYWYMYLMYWVKVNWLYREAVQGLDCLVIAGGGFIKFETQGLNYLVEMLIKAADQEGIPVMFNAVGIEGYDDRDLRCRKLKAALNGDVVKMITTRDDIETLSGRYIEGDRVVTARVGDPAFWIPECFSIEKGASDGPIGINLVNPNNFRTYGGDIDRFSVINFYGNVIEELQLRGLDFVLFTNGMNVDHKFGRLLTRRMNLSPDQLLRRPSSSPELLHMTKEFRVILSSRMHAGIVAHALEVPKVGLIWADKIDFFSSIVGERDTYFDENELDHVKIVDLLEEAREQSDETKKKTEALRLACSAHLGDFLRSVEKDVVRSA